MKSESEQEIEKLNTSLHEYYEVQSTSAVNRLAISSIVLGAGAVITGYFGMNFEREFGADLLRSAWEHAYISALRHDLLGYSIRSAALCFMFFIIAANWQDYRHILLRERAGKSTMPK